MSIAVMSNVWQHSRASHGPLLVLLAIADFASDTGEAFPSVGTLSRKSRLSERATQDAIRELVEIKELRVTPNAGRNGTNLYTVQKLHPAEIAPPQKTADTPANSAPKPSVTVNEGNKEASDDSSSILSKREKKRLPASEPAKRIAALFKRKLTTPWHPKEIKSFKDIGPIDLDDLALVETYHAFEFGKGRDGIHRRDLGTFLNNFLGELDRARAWRDNHKSSHETNRKGKASDRTTADRERGRNGFEASPIPTREI